MSNYEKFFNLIYNKGLFIQYAFEYTDKNRQAIKATYKDAAGFVKSFSVNNSMLDELIAYALKNGVKTDEAGIAASKEIIKTYLKAFVGRNIFDDEAFFPVIQKDDKTLLKAISVLDTLK